MAVTEVVMPSMGADMSEGSIARWLKAEGDHVSRGDILAEVETDKAVVEMEAYGSGVLRKIVVGEGVTVPVGRLIAFIADTDEELPEVEAAGAPVTPAAAPPGAVAAPAVAPAPPAQADAAPAPVGRIKASPVARRLSEEHGIDLATITGTGPGGRIVKTDVEAAVSAAPAAEPSAPAPVSPSTPQPPPLAGEDIPLTPMRQAIARTVVRSKTDQPDFYVTVAVDMTEAVALRKRLNDALDDEGLRVSVNDLVVKAVVMAIEKHPKWNMSFDGDRLKGHPDINVGIAIALEAGLMVPAILRCQGKSLKQLAAEAHALGESTRAGRLSQQQMTGGTFAISNLGMFGVEEFSAIMMPPQPGILAVGAVTPTPVVRDGEIVVREIMKATLTADHRVNDGAEAAVFVGEIRKALENPVGLLL